MRGLRQWMHSPHWGENSVTTRSPGRTLVTASPTRSTIPAPSWPRTVGAYPDGSAPEAVYMSVWHTPQASRRTSTSPAFGSASSTSVTLSGAPNSSSTAARIFTGVSSVSGSRTLVHAPRVSTAPDTGGSVAAVRRVALQGPRSTLLTAALVLTVTATVSAGAAMIPTARTFHGTPTVGALFADATSTHHFCTASVIRSPTGDVLLTAAHCIVGTGAGLSFAPGFHGGVSPYGRWRVRAAYFDRGWLTRRDPRRDYSFLIVAPRVRHGRRTEIQRVTGANALGTRPRSGERVTIPAYPGGAANDPVTCTAPVYFDGVYPAFDCTPYPGGTSGSPWLVRTAHGRTVVGLIGGLHQGGCQVSTSYSPPFGRAVTDVFERAVHGSAADVGPSPGSDGC